MRTVAVVTTSRADYGIYLPVLRRIRASESLDLKLLLTGMHLCPAFGLTAEAIESDGFTIAERVEALVASDTPQAVAKSIGLGVLGFAQVFAGFRPDMLVVLGDRFEMFAAAVASVPFNIPLVHIHGGEVTEGAIDESLRHGITKMSHLHFVATRDYADRLMRMGEAPWRITVSGAPSLDNLRDLALPPVEEIEVQVGMPLPERGFLLVTFHPATRECDRAGAQADEVLEAVAHCGLPAVVSLPNADTGGQVIRERILAHVSMNPLLRAVENLGTRSYFALMSRAAAMVGNSSSGLIEAPSFGLPVVNVGQRQSGRVRGSNVIDVECDRSQIVAALDRALSPQFRDGLSGIGNPYGDGNASERIVRRLESEPLDERLLMKRFWDDPGEGASG